MSTIKFLLCGILFISLMQCTNNKQNLKAYYYPIEELREGRMYEYKIVGNDSIVPEYWFYTTVNSEDGAIFLTGQGYDYAFNVNQFFKEEIVSNGVLLDDYRLFFQDNTGQSVPVFPKIEEANVFPFEAKEVSGFLRTRMLWQNPLDTLLSTVFTRGRQFQGFEEYDYLGKSITCAKFLTTEYYESDHKEEGFSEHRGNTIEYFAKGIGLVYYKKTIDEDNVLEYYLSKRYTMEEFEKELLAE